MTHVSRRRAGLPPGVVLAVLLLAVSTGGCAALDAPAAAWQRWMTQSRREASEAVREIKKDWDFHEGEGLESFGGGAPEQVREMRGDMDRSGTLKTYE